MARSHQSFNKKQIEKKKQQKKKEKEERREERKAQAEEKGPDDMIAYVDEYGNIMDTPPDPDKKEEVKAEDIVLGIPKKEKEEEPEVRTGKVEFYNDEKGYGFIRDDFSGESYFYHINNALEEVGENDKVTYDLEPGPKGLQAMQVKLVS